MKKSSILWKTIERLCVRQTKGKGGVYKSQNFCRYHLWMVHRGNPAGRGCLLKHDIITCGEVCGGIITMHAVTALLQSTALSLSSGTCIAALLSEPNGIGCTGNHGDVAAARGSQSISLLRVRPGRPAVFTILRHSPFLGKVFRHIESFAQASCILPLDCVCVCTVDHARGP